MALETIKKRKKMFFLCQYICNFQLFLFNFISPVVTKSKVDKQIDFFLNQTKEFKSNKFL